MTEETRLLVQVGCWGFVGGFATATVVWLWYVSKLMKKKKIRGSYG